MQGLLKLLFYILVAYVFYKVIRFFQALGSRRPPRRSPRQPSGLMVKDEMCNTYLPKEESIREIHEGREYFFCSEACRQKFLEVKK